jgi:hypothetical protein
VAIFDVHAGSLGFSCASDIENNDTGAFDAIPRVMIALIVATELQLKSRANIEGDSMAEDSKSHIGSPSVAAALATVIAQLYIRLIHRLPSGH